ncbi:MAG TPA: (2Fe-2S)-binding protein, partial [Acidimicrobiales bacterium]
ESCRVGEALLWSNIGAGCASSLGAFMGPLVDRRLEIRDRFEAFLAAGRPELQASGRIAHVGPLWAWERSACCLWYKTDSGFQCEDCSLWSDDERQARYQTVLAELDG